MGFSETWLLPYIPDGGGIALDVGANRGEWTQLLSPRFARVYAIEPNPALRPILDGCGENVRVFPLGAMDMQGFHQFTTYTSDAHLSTFFVQGGINTGVPHTTMWLWCQPIDDLPLEGKVDFIKIDVEGAEREVVLGAKQTIRRDRPFMIIEVHTFIKGVMITGLLKEWGYSIKAVRHPAYTEVPGDVTLWDDHYWLICDPGEAV